MAIRLRVLIWLSIFSFRQIKGSLRFDENNAVKRYRWTEHPVRQESAADVSCHISIIDPLHRARDDVCSSLPVDIPFGEPFVVRSRRQCAQWEHELASFCQKNASLSVQSSEVTRSQQDMSRHYFFPSVAMGPSRECSDRVTNLFRAHREWQTYDLMLQIRQSCMLHSIGCGKGTSASTYANCTHNDIRLPEGSIAREVTDGCRVMSSDNRGELLLELILNAVLKRSESLAPPPLGAIVIHVRVGSPVDNSPYSVKGLLYPERQPGLRRWSTIPPIAYFDHILPSGVIYGSRIVLVVTSEATGRRQAPVPSKSCLVVFWLKQYFIERNASVVAIRVGEKPDDDLVYISQSSTFVPTAGHFSGLAAELVKRRGGIVLAEHKRREILRQHALSMRATKLRQAGEELHSQPDYSRAMDTSTSSIPPHLGPHLHSARERRGSTSQGAAASFEVMSQDDESDVAASIDAAAIDQFLM